MLYAFIIAFILLIFPFIVDVQVYYSNKYRKIAFIIILFKKLRILKGYISKIKEGICVHYSKNKAIILPYKNLLDIKKSIEPFRDYNLLKMSSKIEVGIADLEKKFYFAFLYYYIINFLCNYFVSKKPFLKFNNELSLYNEDKFNLFVSTKVIFNVLFIIIKIFNKIWGKIYETTKNKQN